MKIIWVRGEDFIDGRPRYSIEDHDPSITLYRFQAVIVTEREKYWKVGNPRYRNLYEVSIYDYDRECEWSEERFQSIKIAKEHAEKRFVEMITSENAEMKDVKGSWQSAA